MYWPVREASSASLGVAWWTVFQHSFRWTIEKYGSRFMAFNLFLTDETGHGHAVLGSIMAARQREAGFGCPCILSHNTEAIPQAVVDESRKLDEYLDVPFDHTQRPPHRYWPSACRRASAALFLAG